MQERILVIRMWYIQVDVLMTIIVTKPNPMRLTGNGIISRIIIIK